MAAPNKVMIKTEQLSRTFGQITAVDRLDLEVEQGEIFGLVGPDGAGKTTTIRMLATVMNPTEGCATVAGFDTRKEAAAIKSRIGYMAQQFSLYGDLTVQENLEFFANVFDMRGQKRQERISELLEFARLTEFTRRRGAQLSGGMKKKLGLACALIHQPQILLLDEPTNGVDPVSRREFWNILVDLRVQGVTVLVSTPYMDEAERCSRVGLIYQGQLIMKDTPQKLKQQLNGDVVEVRPVVEGKALDLMGRAEAALTDVPGIREIQTYGERLHVIVDDASERMPQLERAFTDHSIQTEEMRQIQARMDEVFISLIRKRRANGVES